MTQIPKKVAITGGIGSGKSVVCKILEAFNYPVFYSDQAAKKILATHPDVRHFLEQVLGEKAFLANQKPNHPLIAKHIFNQPDRLKKLNELVHPKVRQHFNQWAVGQQATLVFNESALVFEANIAHLFDATVLVWAHDHIKIKRILQRDPQRTTEQVKAIMQKQLPDSEKKRKATYCIENNPNRNLTQQVADLRRRLESF